MIDAAKRKILLCLIATLVALKDLLAREPIHLYRPHPLQVAAHKDTRPWVLYVGANGIGKTVWLVHEVYWWVTGTHPYKKIPPAPFTIYVVSKDLSKLETEQGQFHDMLMALFPKGHPMGRPKKVADHVFQWPNDGQPITIIYKSDNQDIYSFEGGLPALVVIDEEVELSAYNAANYRRMRGATHFRNICPGTSAGQLLLGATSLHRDKAGKLAGGGQWIWRVLMQGVAHDKVKGGPHVDRGIYCGDAWDNPFLDDTEILRQLRQTPAEDIPARFLGDMQPRASRPVFSLLGLTAIWERRLGMEIPVWRGSLEMRPGMETPRLQEDFNGALEIYRRPVEGHRYFVGVDSSRGGKSDDFQAVQVYDDSTCEQAARWHGHTDPEGFGDIAVGIGALFFYAMLVIELAKEGYAVMNTSVRLYGYQNHFHQVSLAADSQQQVAQKGIAPNDHNKAQAIAALERLLKRSEHRTDDGRLHRHAPPLHLYDRMTVDQLRTFERSQTGKLGAPNQDGLHDDLVMALGWAVFGACSPGVDRQYVHRPTKREVDAMRAQRASQILHPVLGSMATGGR